MQDHVEFERGTLWRCTVAATARALGRHSLRPIVTRGLRVKDGSVEFGVRVLAGRGEIAHEAHMHTAEAAAAGATAAAIPNPFLPYDKDMFVADLSATHVCLLNKYTVIPHHVLMVTRSFEAQESALTLADFEAMWLCLAEFDGFAFYNAGKVAGASQRHKHLQYAPLPFVAHSYRLPIEAGLPAAQGNQAIHEATSLPFQHALTFFPAEQWRQPLAAAAPTLDIYRAMLARLGLVVAGQAEPQPYNLLAARRWMMIIPRTNEKYAGIAVNGLGYAGSLLVRDAAQLALLAATGPLALLAQVGLPKLA